MLCTHRIVLVWILVFYTHISLLHVGGSSTWHVILPPLCSVFVRLLIHSSLSGQESTIVEADNNAEMRATKKRLAANKPKSRLKEKHLVITMDLISSRHTNNSHHQTGNASSGSATDGGNHFPSENSGDNGSGIVVRKARSSLLNDEHGTGQAELDAVEDDYDEICLSDSETRHLLLTEEESQKRYVMCGKPFPPCCLFVVALIIAVTISDCIGCVFCCMRILCGLIFINA